MSEDNRFTATGTRVLAFRADEASIDRGPQVRGLEPNREASVPQGDHDGRWIFRRPSPLVLTVLACLLACFAILAGRATAAPQDTVSAPKLTPAAIKAAPDLKCKLHLADGAASDGLTVYTDEDGYARFHALKTTAESTARRHMLTCSNEAGQVSTFPVDLAANETFAPRPFDLSKARGVDRPALTGDPKSFTQEQLVQRGYGLRPDPEKAPDAYRAWLEAASRPGRILLAKKEGDKISHGVTTTQAPTWIGTVMTGSAPYALITSVFVVPTAQPGAWGTTGTAAVIWPGLGGFNTGSGLIQAGVGIYTSATTAVYTTWREYCCGDADSNGYGGAFTPSPGDKILAQVWYCDANGAVNLNGGFGCSYLYDYNSQAIFGCTAPRGQPSSSPCWSVKALPACSVSPNTPNCMTFGVTAETIVENASPQLTPPTDQFPPFTPSLFMTALAGAPGKAVTLETDPSVLLLTDYPHRPPPVTVAIVANETSFTVGPPASSDPFGYSFIDRKTGLTEQHNIFRGADAHVHAVWFNFASGWHQEDRSTFAPGVPAAEGNPFGYAFVNETTGLTEQHNLFVSADGHIHALWFNFTQGWHHEDRTGFFSDAPPSSGNPRGYAFVNETTGLTEQHNIYRSADGHIHAFWFNFATGWHHEDRTAIVPGVPPAVGDPWGYAFVNEKTGLAEQHILFRTADGHIHALWFNFSQGWHHEDRTTFVPGVPPAKGNPFGYAFVNQTTGLTEQHNLFVSNDGHVQALWFNFSQGWHHEDRTAMLPNVPASVSDPWGYPFVDEKTGLTEQHNLFRTADGHIHALWFNFSQGWHHEDRSTLVPGVAPGIGTPTGYPFVNETTGLTEQHNLFRLSNGSIAALWFNFSGGWHYEVRY